MYVKKGDDVHHIPFHQQQIIRSFTYTTTALLAGASIQFFTNNFITLTESPDLQGTLFLIGFALIYANITFLLVRRYIQKPASFQFYSYVLSVVIVLPILILVLIKGDVFASTATAVTYFAAIAAGSAAGAWYGIKKGLIKREERRKKLHERNLKNPQK